MTQFVIATAGATTDGREIQAEWLEQAAANYDPNKYGARINCEHMRGIVPNGVFPAFGDVTALSTGKNSDGQTTLLAEINPTDTLKQLIQDRQKIYTSCEFDTNFANTGEAYLVGLAVTDSPASLGTSMLKFSATLPDDEKPLSYMKKRPENIISETVEIPKKFSVGGSDEEKEKGILAKVKHLLSREGAKTKKLSSDNEEVKQALELLATENAELREKLDKAASADELAKFKSQVQELVSLKASFTDIIQKIEGEPAPQYTTNRPAALGVESENVDY